MKQHIEKHYDIHPQKGVLKKKSDDVRGNQGVQSSPVSAPHLTLGSYKTKESVQIESQIQVRPLPIAYLVAFLQQQQLLRQVAENLTSNPLGFHRKDDTIAHSADTGSGSESHQIVEIIGGEDQREDRS